MVVRYRYVHETLLRRCREVACQVRNYIMRKQRPIQEYAYIVLETRARLTANIISGEEAKKCELYFARIVLRGDATRPSQGFHLRLAVACGSCA